MGRKVIGNATGKRRRVPLVGAKPVPLVGAMPVHHVDAAASIGAGVAAASQAQHRRQQLQRRQHRQLVHRPLLLPKPVIRATRAILVLLACRLNIRIQDQVHRHMVLCREDQVCLHLQAKDLDQHQQGTQA